MAVVCISHSKTGTMLTNLSLIIAIRLHTAILFRKHLDIGIFLKRAFFALSLLFFFLCAGLQSWTARVISLSDVTMLIQQVQLAGLKLRCRTLQNLTDLVCPGSLRNVSLSTTSDETDKLWLCCWPTVKPPHAYISWKSKHSMFV